MTKKQKKNLYRIIVSAVFLVVLNLIPTTGLLRAGLFLTCYLVIGYDVLKKAGRGIVNGRVFDENFLMAIATVGAIALAIYGKTGDYNEAVAVMLFYQIGEWFQSYAVGRSRKSINALMDIRPDYANVEQDGKLIQVSPDCVAVGSEIVVRPGEKIPLDGIVVKGESVLNTSALTGESLPCEVTVGSGVISGCVNMRGVITVRTTKVFAESTVSKILELVENAGSRKAKAEKFISRFSRVYTPAVCIGALTLAVLPPLVLSVLGQSGMWGVWLYRALTFLVISCPCALVISVPLSFFAGLGGASREGILIKGANYLEALAKTKYVVFDKTGTLTKGVFQVVGIHDNTVDAETLLSYAALAESASSHPIAQSLQRAYEKNIDSGRVGEIQELSGQGIIAVIDGKNIAVGNDKLMMRVGAAYKDCHASGTILHIAIDGVYAGHIVVSDVVKEDATSAIDKLKKAGVEQCIMLTGDRETVAKAVAEELALDGYYSELLPADKVARVESILAEKSDKETLVFVGDGINDAPVLARADIGIAMGAMGSDAAVEAADVVLMDDDLQKLAKAVKISRKCLGIVKQNIYFAIGIKLVCLALGAVGFANMWLAIFADVGVMVIAVLNAIRALQVKNL